MNDSTNQDIRHPEAMITTTLHLTLKVPATILEYDAVASMNPLFAAVVFVGLLAIYTLVIGG